MSRYTTVSGNDTVSGNAPPPITGEETTTAVYTYLTDTSTMEALLTSILEEARKQNENLETVISNLKEYMEADLQNRVSNQILAEDIEETEAEQEEAEKESEQAEEKAYRETVLMTLEGMDGRLYTANESLDSLNATVSGNASTLDTLAGTTETLSQTYTEETQAQRTSTNYQLSIGIGILFAVALLLGALIAKTFWGRMK